MKGVNNDLSHKKIDKTKIPILRPDNLIEQLFYYPPSVA